MTTYTPRLRIPIPDFNVRPWHSELEATFERIDKAIFDGVLIGSTSAWGNDLTFEVGDIAIDTDGTYWVALTAHVSAASPVIFADDRTAHPGYWVSAVVAPTSRGEWVAATTYAVNDFITHENGFFVCLIPHTSTSSFATDVDSGFWSGLVDLTETIYTVNFAESNARASAGRAEAAWVKVRRDTAIASAAAIAAAASAATYDEDQNVLNCLVYT